MKTNLVLIGLFMFSLMLGSVMAHNIDLNANTLEKDFKIIKQDYKKATTYKVTRNCDDVVLLNRIWDKRQILSIETYQDARHPHKDYCGIIYLNIK